MKFTAGIIAALAGCAAAVTTSGEAFTFPRDESGATASLGCSLARLVLLQRLAGPGEGPTIRDIPEGINTEDAVATLNKYAPFREALFSTEPGTVPKRLLVMVDGMTVQQIKDAKDALGQDATFTIDDLPSSAANRDLFEIDAYNAGAINMHSCSLGEIVEMTDKECWSKESTAARYSVAKNPESMKDILEALRSIPKLAKVGVIESTIVLLPETNQNAKPSWSDQPQELRRRQAEQVISSNHKSTPVSDTPAAASSGGLFIPKKTIPSCFNSKEACIAATGNCSSPRGECVNKYGAVPENPKDGEVCFTCLCARTPSTSGKGSDQWAGPTCAKKDVSVPFWLFFGFTIAIVGVVWGSISLLFSVGEEKLPGVIGAGVSRAK